MTTPMKPREPLDVARWLASREPAPPPSLVERVGELLRGVDVGGRAPLDVADGCLRAAERALQQLLAEDCSTRRSALDLLSIDALVTYAFEVASETPEAMTALTADAMHRLAALGAPAGADAR